MPPPLAALPVQVPATESPELPPGDVGLLAEEPPLVPVEPLLPELPPPPPAATTATSAPAPRTPPTMAIVGMPPPPAAPPVVLLAVELPAEALGAAPVLEMTTPSELKPARAALPSSTFAAAELRMPPEGSRAIPITIGWRALVRKRASLRSRSQCCCFFTTRGV